MLIVRNVRYLYIESNTTTVWNVKFYVKHAITVNLLIIVEGFINAGEDWFNL